MLHSPHQAIQDIENLLKNGKELSLVQILLMLSFTASLGLETSPLYESFTSIMQERGYTNFESWASNVFHISFLCSPQEDIDMAKQIAASLSPKFERYLDLTAIYFSANAVANAVSSGCCGLKSRTSLLRRNRGKRE